MPVSREAVLWAFRLVLGREPESESGIRAHQALADETALMRSLLRSAEFRASRRFEDLISLRDKATADRQPRWNHDVRAAWNAVVFGNCQAQGIARLMQAMTGDVDTCVYETTPSLLRRLKSGELDLSHVLRKADVVFVQAVGEVVELVRQKHPRDAHKLRLLPALAYGGFHPDVVYIRDEGGYLSGPMGEYHSSIAFWAWRQGLNRSQAVGLFRPEVFEHLSFDAYHQSSYQALVELGRATDLAMAPLMDRWNQRGCWMHTVNHPKLWALADMVAAVLRREGIMPLEAAASCVDDPLVRWPVWPVYPGVAEVRGIEGSFVFKLDHGESPLKQPVLSLDLDGFIDASFSTYSKAKGRQLACPRVESHPYATLRRFVMESRRPLRKLFSQAKEILFSSPPTETSDSGQAQPYQGLPDSSFWRRAVADVAPGDIDPVVQASLRLSRTDRIATAGSCFAQHIARTLQREGFNYFVVDSPAGLDASSARDQGYGVYSARYGNVYTARQLVQLFDRAHGEFRPIDDAWQRPDGRWVDPFRPQVDATGFDSADAVRADTARHLADVRRLFAELDVFIFTLGLTEAWRSCQDGAVYPLAPGVVASRFDPQRHEFANFDVSEVQGDLDGFIHRLRSVNPRARILLTVSPVPLIATYGHQHVLSATVHSKSVLRVAASAAAVRHPGVDYFPSYEIVTGAAARGGYFAADLRSVTDAGVAHVMRVFMAHYGPVTTDSAAALPPAPSEERIAALRAEHLQVQEIVCDEEAIERHRH